MASKSANPDASRAGSRRSTADTETVLVGRVLRPHGLRGEVKIEVLSDVAERFDAGRELWWVKPGTPRRRLRISTFRAIRGGALLGFEGLASREDSEALRGGRLEVGVGEVPAAPAGCYYHFELIGCRCFDAEHGELGEVVDVLEDGGGDLLRLLQADGLSLLVPFVGDFLVAVDVEAGRIDLRLPPGLVESCVSRS